jgi:hypothetical protein
MIKAYNLYMSAYYFPYNYFHLIHDIVYPLHTWLVEKELLDKKLFVKIDIKGRTKAPNFTLIYKHVFDFLYPNIYFINGTDDDNKYEYEKVARGIKHMRFSKENILIFKNYVLSKLGDSNTDSTTDSKTDSTADSTTDSNADSIILIDRDNKPNIKTVDEDTKSIINKRWLSRDSTKYITNMDELKKRLEDYCAKKGLKLHVLRCENLSFEEQVRYFSKAVCVVAQQGAGAVNCLWMDEGSLFVEYLSWHYEVEFEFYKANDLNHTIIEYPGSLNRSIQVDCNKVLDCISSQLN